MSDLLQLLKSTIHNYCDEHFDKAFNSSIPYIKFQESTLSADEVCSAVETLLSANILMGKKVRSFEQLFAAYNQTQYAVMSHSGSCSNLLSIAALANPKIPDYLKPGDEVIISALSSLTTLMPIIHHQLIPVLVDCSLETFNLDVNKLENAIGPKTRAIQITHVFGNPCDMDAILTLAKKYRLFVVEDCRESIGARYHNKPVGSFGDLGNFSLSSSRHISAIGGGITVTNNMDYAETLRNLRSNDIHQNYPHYIGPQISLNTEPTELNAAIGMHQLLKLDNFIIKRRDTAAFFIDALLAYEDIFNFQNETIDSEHVWFGFPIMLKEKAPFTLKDITDFLNQNNIETTAIVSKNLASVCEVKSYPHRIAGSLSNADYIIKHGFAFGCHQAIDQKAQHFVIETIKKFLNQVKIKINSAKSQETV